MYEGSPYHKRNPGNFGLDPPAAPRPDATLCDEAGVTCREVAAALFHEAIRHGIVSEATATGHYPKQLWVVDAGGQVFESMYGGSRLGCYHGYPIRRSDPLSDEIRKRWSHR